MVVAAVCPTPGMVSSSATASATGASRSSIADDQLRHLPLQEVNLVEEVAEHDPLERLDAPVQGLAQQRELGAQPSARELGQRLRITFTGENRLQHIASALPQHVRRHRSQFQVGPFQELVQPVDRLRALGDQRRMVACQFAQLPHGFRRNETGLEQPVAQQVRQPFGVLASRLAPRDRLHVLRIHQDHIVVGLQQVIDGPPQHAR